MKRRAIVPSRVNIIGEHTDYTGGLALPFAIDYNLTLEAVERENGFSGDSTVVKLWKSAGGWPADLTVTSTIPIGKGMSSSAALCLAIVLCSNGPMNSLEASKEAQRIEHEVLGTPCGLLDQLAMMNAKEGHASLIDFSDLSVKYVQIPHDWRFKLVDSKIERQLSSTQYGKENSFLEQHVKDENARVSSAISSSAIGLGELLNQSHASLISLGVSLPEMDHLVESIQQEDGVLGARMMGGGFGGMILVLVEGEDVFPEIPFVKSSKAAILDEIF